MWQWLKDKLFESVDSDGPLGTRGENVAAKYLRNLGYTILLRNYRNALGEIDIIARDGRTIVFVEVKTRVDDGIAPETQVDARKQRQITRVAKKYMTRYGVPPPPARFDVIAIVWPGNGDPIVRHLIAAFEPTD